MACAEKPGNMLDHGYDALSEQAEINLQRLASEWSRRYTRSGQECASQFTAKWENKIIQIHSSATFNPVLHGLRGLAALGVLVFHFDVFFPQLASTLKFNLWGSTWDFSVWLGFGWLGVYLFFVLSGYLLASQMRTRTLEWPYLRQFWLRRVIRIYPAYWLQLFILLAVANLLLGLPERVGGWEVVRHVLLWINLPPWMTKPINGVWWTLPIELSFYLVLPLLVFMARRIGWARMFLCCLAITLCWRWGAMMALAGSNYSDHLVVLDALPGTLTVFAAGVAVAHLPFLLTRQQRLATVLSCAAMVYLMIQWLLVNLDSYWTGHWMLMVWPTLMAIIIAGLLFSLLDRPSGFAFMASRPMVWLGEVSFGIYLWHFPVLLVEKAYWPAHLNTLSGSVIAILACIGLTLGLAAISYYALERPAMRWGGKLLPARS